MTRRASSPLLPVNDEARSFASAYLRDSLAALRGIGVDAIVDLIDVLDAARAAGQRIFTCGNGGSAATASHFAAGLGRDASWEQPLRFRAQALTDSVPWVTGVANDAEYAAVFVEQLRSHAQRDDVLIAFSASGNSDNVVHAVDWANAHGLVTVGITGRDGGRLRSLVALRVSVASDHVGHVEEGHFLIQHLVTYAFMAAASSPRP